MANTPKKRIALIRGRLKRLPDHPWANLYKKDVKYLLRELGYANRRANSWREVAEKFHARLRTHAH